MYKIGCDFYTQSPDMDVNTVKLKGTVCNFNIMFIVLFQIQCARIQSQNNKKLSKYIQTALYLTDSLFYFNCDFILLYCLVLCLFYCCLCKAL